MSDNDLRELEFAARTGGDAEKLRWAYAYLRTHSVEGPRVPESEQLAQLKKSCETFINDVYRLFDSGLVIATVRPEDEHRHEFEYRYLLPFMHRTVRYLAQYLPPGTRCRHIHDAHGVSRCVEKVRPGERYCENHVRHRDNWPQPRHSDEYVEQVTAKEIAEMKGEVYDRD